VLYHRAPETGVVWVAGVRTAVAIIDPFVRSLIFVGPFLARNLGHGRDAQGQLANGWLEDALWSYQRDAAPIDLESAFEYAAGQHRASMQGGLLLQEIEGRHPDGSIEVGSHCIGILEPYRGTETASLRAGLAAAAVLARLLRWTPPPVIASYLKP